MALDRTTFTLVLGLVGVLAVGWLRPDERADSWDKNHPTRFWARKVAWEHELDLVFAGDSRVAFGIAPDATDGLGAGLRVGNFGFLGNGFTAEYLDAVERTLDPASGRRTIALGFSPRSVVPTLTWTNEFTEARDLGLSERLTALHFSDELWTTRRMDLESLRAWIDGTREIDEVAYTFRDDGWIETRVRNFERLSRLDRMAPITEPVAPYPPTLVEAVVAAVARWRAEGIEVYGFRTPAPAERAANENVLYRFDEAELRDAFERAGGVWLTPPEADYTFWDSSHMDDVSGRAYTRALVEEIRGNHARSSL